MPSNQDVDSVPIWKGQQAVCHCFDEPLTEPAVLTPFFPQTSCQSRCTRVVNAATSVSNLRMTSVESTGAGECSRFTGPAPCRPFLGPLFTSTLSINSFTGFCVQALSVEGYSALHVSNAITLTSSLGNRVSHIQSMKPDPGSQVTMTFSKATRLFSCWSNSGKSSSSSLRDSREFCSATTWKSLACEATLL